MNIEYPLACLRVPGFILAVLLMAAPAYAEPSVLVVVQGGVDQDPATLELRLRSELTAEGLEVVTASGRSQQNLLDLEGLARRTGAVAGLSAFVDVQSIDGRLWVTDPSSNVDLVRTLHVSRTESDPVSVFALRAVEALRGARLELEHQKRRLSGGAASPTDSSPTTPASTSGAANAPPAAKPVASPAPVPPKTNQTPQPLKKVAVAPKTDKRGTAPRAATGGTAPRPWMLLGSGILASDRNGVGIAPGPGLELRRAVIPHVSVALSFDGPLFSKMNPKSNTTVHINQEWLEVQARWAAIQSSVVTVELLGSSGLSRFAVKGETTQTPFRGLSAQGIEWIAGAGVGFGLRLSDRFCVGFDAQWLRRIPAPVIVDQESKPTGKLTGDKDSLLLGKLGFGVMF